VATPARLGVVASRLVAEGHRGGLGREPCRGLPMAQARTREGGGVGALRRRAHPGGPSKLTTEQRAKIPVLLARGAEAYGFRGDVWTAKRIAEVRWRTFGVRYHPDHVSRLLRQAGWSVQRPIQRATQRDEAASTRWQEERGPAIKKRRATKGTPASG
jgi:transposase